MNIPGFFGGNAVGGSTVSGCLGLVVDEALTANALCDPDDSPMSCVYWSLARRKLTWRAQANARFQPRLAPIFGVLDGSTSTRTFWGNFRVGGNTLRALPRESSVSLASAGAFSRRPSSGRLLLRDLSRADNGLGTLS